MGTSPGSAVRQSSGAPESGCRRKIRILLVDDNPDSLLSLEAILEGSSDELVVAQSGAEALRHVLADDDFAAILLDVKMPDIDGFETARLIRSRRRNRHTPILFLTAFPSDSQLVQGYDLGAVDFLFKPIVPEILRSKVSVFVELARNTQLLRDQADVLAKAEQKFRSLLEAAPDATVITTADGSIVLVNSRTLELFQHSRSDLLGRNLRMIVPDWAFTGEVTNGDLGQMHEQSGNKDLRGVRRDGSAFPVEISLNPLETEEGLLITTVIRDITERRRTEERILRLNIELEQRVTERTAELMRTNEALRQFAWAASHDLQEPLRMVLTYSELLSRECRNMEGRQRHFLGVVQTGANRMHELMEALRQFVQTSEAGQLDRSPVDCKDIVEQVLVQLSISIRESSAIITCDPLPTVMGVPILLTQILQNLLANAIKYRGTEHPRIHIRADRTEYEWIFSVHDNGIGIAPQYHERIFGVFRRLYPNQYPGTGIGLAICRTAVERLGGRIWVESEPNKGADFRFTIPASPNLPTERPTA